VAREAWRDRGFLDDALIPGAALAGPEGLAALARAGHPFVSF
jgi:hypothetical protein